MSERIIPSQQTPKEVESLIADMELVASLANDEEYHGPLDGSVRADVDKDIKDSIDKLIVDAAQAKALFAVMILDNNEVVSVRCGKSAALARVVMCVGHENMGMAHEVAAEIRSAIAKAEEEATKDSVDGSSC